MSITASLASLTRALQRLNRRRPLGITALMNVLQPHLPPFSGVIGVEDGLRFQVDTAQPLERRLLWTGDVHRALTDRLRRHTPSGAFCLDIGANIGFYALRFARWAGAGGRVAAFEASPAAAAALRANIARNGVDHVEVLALAVAAQPGRAVFHLSADLRFSSLTPAQREVGSVEVECITVDGFMASAGWPRLDVIKIDIEGADCSAIMGAAESLRRFRPFIALEYSPNAADAGAALSLLGDLGYRLTMLVKRDGRELPFDPGAPASRHSFDLLAYPPGDG